LDDQQEKLALERKYGQVEEDQVTSSNTEQSTTPRESKRIRQEHEPIAYVFDDPIAEPNADTFRMQIGVKHSDPAQKIGKASTSIAFVLGHAVYQSEPVTKILLRPLSGRRHQLRLHTSHHGFPIGKYCSDATI
jgi:23S rRNA-/tRNA-specific pseudouridylate synthase